MSCRALFYLSSYIIAQNIYVLVKDSKEESHCAVARSSYLAPYESISNGISVYVYIQMYSCHRVPTHDLLLLTPVI